MKIYLCALLTVFIRLERVRGFQNNNKFLQFQRPEPSSSVDADVDALQITTNPSSSPSTSSSTSSPTLSPTPFPSKSPTSPSKSPTRNPSSSPTTKNPSQSPSSSPTSYNCACCDHFVSPDQFTFIRQECSNNVECTTYFNDHPERFETYIFDTAFNCYYNDPDDQLFENSEASTYSKCDPNSWDASGACALP